MDQSTEFEAIRERHEKCCFTVTKTEWSKREAFNAHTDRATLIALVEAANARADKAEAELARVREAKWTDDDQCSLNAAVYDCMWDWDEVPMDTDDAISLAEMLKDKLRENGLRLARAVKGEG